MRSGHSAVVTATSVREDRRTVHRRIFAAAAAVVALATIAAPSATAATAVTKLYPNVVPLTTDEVAIQHSASGHKQLRLSYAAENAGAGPLELQGVRQDCDGDGSTRNDRTAMQNIFGDSNTDGTYTAGADEVVRQRVVGCFEFDPSHGHWHFENYARFQLFDLQGTKVGSHSKVGFCLIDSDHVEPALPGSPSGGVYESCAPDLQGSSIGWADIYGANLPGQFIGIDDVADGDYCLVSTADPKAKIRESDETDNVFRTPVTIQGDQATIGSTPC